MKSLSKGLGKLQYNSPVILTFSLLSFMALLLGLATENQTTALLFSVYKSNVDVLFFVRLFGHVLGHANFDHFFNNFLIILMVGPMLEEKYGSLSMALMILITAAVTGVAQVLLFPGTALLGASGIVFMLILLSSFVNLKKGRIPLTLIFCVLIYIGREVFSAVASTDNISQFGHIIGGFCGAAFGIFINRKKLFHDDENDTAVDETAIEAYTEAPADTGDIEIKD